MEQLLYYIWQNRLFDTNNLTTTCNVPLQIIDVGMPNSNAGPDFFNAKIIIGDTLWAGNIEIHIKSSDWYKHRHDGNKNYDSVILHVIKQCDAKIYRQNGEAIPQLTLTYPESVAENYEYLLSSNTTIPCSLLFKEVPSILIRSWLDSLLSERFEQKTTKITELLAYYNNDYEEVLYVLLARHFGTGINTDAFERLARSISFKILLKHANFLFQLEALLFGQAGLLEQNDNYADYWMQLKKEYAFLQKKYELQNMEGHVWKAHRVRPSNFPELRIAQFAALCISIGGLFSKILKTKNITEQQMLFQSEPSAFWKIHYNFKQIASFTKKKAIGLKLIENLQINVIIPLMFVYGKNKNDIQLMEKSWDFLEKIPAENNKIIREWQQIGVVIENAADTQALLQLKKYCEQKKCLFCRIGQKLLAKKSPM